jgi:hypothetical protein
MGWAQRGSLKYVPVCRVCNEIMEGWTPAGGKSWEDFGRASKYPPYKFVKIDYFIFAISMVLYASVLIWPNPITTVLMWLGIAILVVRLVQIIKIRKSQK